MGNKAHAIIKYLFQVLGITKPYSTYLRILQDITIVLHIFSPSK